MSDSGLFSGGLFARFRGMLDKILALVQTRLEIFSIELKEEKNRIIEIVIWTSAAIFLGAMAFIVVTFSVIFIFWEDRSARIASLIAFSVAYVGLAGFSFYMLRKKIQSHGVPFSQSLREINKDRKWLSPSK